MAVVFQPDSGRLRDVGYASVAHVPVVFDSAHRYHREINRYLRERAALEWTPRGDSAMLKRAKGRRISYPAPSTLLAYANALKNFIEWCEARKLDWRRVEYQSDLLRYRDDMLAGIWSKDGRRLSCATAEGRVDRAIEFLTWAADCGLRDKLTVPIARGRRTGNTGTSPQGGTRDVTRRAGRNSRKAPQHLRLPTKDELATWLSEVETRRGAVKALACRTALELALRKQEIVGLRMNVLPRDRRQWDIVGNTVLLHITEGTKGGKDRWVNCPLRLALDIHRYITGRRLRAVSLWNRAHQGAKAPDALFLSEINGSPLSAPRFYEAWTSWRMFDGWSPHLGRHTWACYTLLDAMKAEAERVGATLDKLPQNWIFGTGESLIRLHVQPQLGHVDASTSDIYLRWIMNHMAVAPHYETWHDFLGGDNG